MAPGLLSNGYDKEFQYPSSMMETKYGQPELESIAVIGLSLKFPQEAISPDSFWSVLMDARCTMTEVPRDRFNGPAFFHPDSNRLDAVSVTLAKRHSHSHEDLLNESCLR